MTSESDASRTFEDDPSDVWFDYCPTCQRRYSHPAHPQDRGCDETPDARPVLCPTRTPEPHLLAEFPMTCYRCHIDADS